MICDLGSFCLLLLVKVYLAICDLQQFPWPVSFLLYVGFVISDGAILVKLLNALVHLIGVPLLSFLFSFYSLSLLK